nr:hypothetical protein [Tanacetum cinerariifolium]
MSLDDFKIIFYLPQATDNNHDHFVPAPKFPEMVSFYIHNLGFTLELRSTSSFKKTGLLQPWQTLCKMFSRFLTIRITGFHYPLEHPTTMIPYPKFTKLITAFPEISRRARDIYQNLEDDVMFKSIFNSEKMFGVDVPTNQSQPIESTHETHHIPPRRSTCLTQPTPIPTTDEADDPVLQDTLQVSLAEQKSREELKAKQNEEQVKEHLMAEEIEKLVEGTKFYKC